MLLRFMSDFMANMPTQLPDLLPKKRMEKPAVYGDYAHLVFHPKKRHTTEEVVNMLEEEAHLVLVYHRVVSGLKGWQCCCAITNPCFKRMYKFNAIADDDGYVTTIEVFIFESIEIMRATLRLEVDLHAKAGGMRYKISEADLLKMFL